MPTLQDWIPGSAAWSRNDDARDLVVAVSATVMSDTLSLVVFAICVSIFVGGFSVPAISLQLVEIVVFVPLVLFGLSRIGARLLKKMEDEENGYFVFLLLILTVTLVRRFSGFGATLTVKIGAWLEEAALLFTPVL